MDFSVQEWAYIILEDIVTEGGFKLSDFEVKENLQRMTWNLKHMIAEATGEKREPLSSGDHPVNVINETPALTPVKLPEF